MGPPARLSYRRFSQLPKTPTQSPSDVIQNQKIEPKAVSTEPNPSTKEVDIKQAKAQGTRRLSLNNLYTKPSQFSWKAPITAPSTPSTPSNIGARRLSLEPNALEPKTQANEQRAQPYRGPPQYLTPTQYKDQRHQNDANRMQRRYSMNCSSSQQSGYSPKPPQPGLPSESTAPESSQAPTSTHPYRRPSQGFPTPIDPKTFRYDYNGKAKSKTADSFQHSRNKPGHLHRRTYGPPSQLISSSDLDDKNILYIRNLSMEIVHHQVFELFSAFGNLKRVYVHQRSENYKYAMIIYITEESMKRALSANPHRLNDRKYICQQASPWHLGHFKIDSQLSGSINRTNFRERFQMRLPYGVVMRSYFYESHPSPNQSSCIIADRDRKRKSALLPPLCLALLHYTYDKQPLPKPGFKTEPAPVSSYQQQLFAGMGKGYRFQRHSYTNFVAYQKKPGHYESVPIDHRVGLTAVAYADLRDRLELISFHYH
ncbi:uncharacterized protein LOC6574952 [Drosophila mojavensis]|uniref:RRM domain-containing protein n=1 Tax=Drosophila mojavensis TaxID=7230 RepID=B4K7R9_DROMO|nr:uncharacterized protein LOC6574952 [Drosophila mojavensis]EDW16440.2 uncharacterized protein Dmoj_GI22234 [Drosophila mojavensis]